MTYAGPVHLTLASSVLASSSTDSNPGAGLGLVIFLVLLVGCVFLFRSMSGRIKRLPDTFDASAEPPVDEAEARPDGDQ